MEVKIIKVDPVTHAKVKKDAKTHGMTIKGYVKKLIEQGLVK